MYWLKILNMLNNLIFLYVKNINFYLNKIYSYMFYNLLNFNYILNNFKFYLINIHTSIINIHFNIFHKEVYHLMKFQLIFHNNFILENI